MRYSRFLLTTSIALLCSNTITTVCNANSFGVYDSRTLAMGGTSVAIGTVNVGHFYNPALTAFHIGDEDKTKDGRQTLHIVANVVSDGVAEASEALSYGLDGQLGSTIDDLNSGEDRTQDATEGFNLANELLDAMISLDGVTLGADFFLGYSLSEPGDHKGGAFYVGTRLLASGATNVTESDFDILRNYIDLFDFIQSGGQNGKDQPDLIDADGFLIDPSTEIQSSATGTAVIKSELAVSFSKIHTVWGQEIGFGATPKIIQLNTYDTDWFVSEGTFGQYKSKTNDIYLNVDLGLAINLGDNFRVGLSVKEARTKIIKTKQGRKLKLGAYQRLGFAFFQEHFSVGIDIDLSSAPNLQNNTNRKDMSVGVEVKAPKQFLIRAGYRQDLASILEDTFSFGLGWSSENTAFDLAYTNSGTTQGAAIQFSFLH